MSAAAKGIKDKLDNYEKNARRKTENRAREG